ncbi:hypothetical protein [Marivita cryptomonadis]|uniref:hypothetical protein n=1 Tax=Marivita cryptomonadis TaxID=505252 RepID=UPI00391A7881
MPRLPKEPDRDIAHHNQNSGWPADMALQEGQHHRHFIGFGRGLRRQTLVM